MSKKIRGLRTQYVREKNKMKIRKCGDDSYVTKWSYYEKLKFLDEHITARSTQFKVHVHACQSSDRCPMFSIQSSSQNCRGKVLLGSTN